MKKVALAKVKDDLSRYLRVAEGPAFLRRVTRARGAIRRGRGVRLEDVPA
jgi:hypothetical protein